MFGSLSLIRLPEIIYIPSFWLAHDKTWIGVYGKNMDWINKKRISRTWISETSITLYFVRSKTRIDKTCTSKTWINRTYID